MKELSIFEPAEAKKLNMHTKTTRLSGLKKLIEEQNDKQSEAKNAEAYTAIDEQIRELKLSQTKLLPEYIDYVSEFEELKREIIEHMKVSGQTQIGNVFAKFKKTKAVNGMRVLEALGGDIGTFIEMAKVSQKHLKDFADLESNARIKKQLMLCVELQSVEISDLKIEL